MTGLVSVVRRLAARLLPALRPGRAEADLARELAGPGWRALKP